MDYSLKRRQVLLRQLAKLDVDALLLTSPINVRYLTGFTGDSSYLLLGRERTLLVSDGRYTQQIAEECPGLDAVIRPADKWLQNATAEVLNDFGIRTIGFESAHLSVAEWETLRELTPALAWKPCKNVV